MRLGLENGRVGWEVWERRSVVRTVWAGEQEAGQGRQRMASRCPWGESGWATLPAALQWFFVMIGLQLPVGCLARVSGESCASQAAAAWMTAMAALRQVVTQRQAQGAWTPAMR